MKQKINLSISPCIYYYLKDEELIQFSNSSCFAGIKHIKSEFIYMKLDDFKVPEVTDKQRTRVIRLLNNITFCKIVKIDNIEYVKFLLLDKYCKNTLLLNFIRGFYWLQNETIFNYKQYYIDICKRKPSKKDTLQFMLECVKNNVNQTKGYEGDHSFIYRDIIPKTKQQLLDYKGDMFSGFLKANIN